MKILRLLRKKKAKPGLETPLPGQRLYTIKQAARFLGRTVYSCRSLIWAGKLPVIQTEERGKIWIDLKDLERFIEINKITMQ